MKLRSAGFVILGKKESVFYPVRTSPPKAGRRPDS